jgi:uncharacterized protein
MTVTPSGQLSSRAVVQVDRPSPYLKQLCKHFRHRQEVTFTDTEGTLTFPYGSCELTAAEATLTMVATAGDAEGLARVEEVVGGHLERFGRRDSLSVTWTREGGTQ